MNVQNKTLYSLLAISAVAIAVGVYRSYQIAGARAVPVAAAASVRPAALVSLRPMADLGTVSMAGGKVKFGYLVKNTGAEPLTINRVYTSCMCTVAMLTTAEGPKGPFGMPGHGLPNSVRAVLAAGDTARVEVVFDPAAHGPSGLGRIDRVVTLESAESAPLELRMTAMVRP